MLRFTAITPSMPNFSHVTRELNVAARNVADRHQRMFEATTTTWRRRPRFTRVISVLTDEVAAEVSTTNQIYFYLNEGTDVRYATMTPDFVPKTAPGLIGSGPGRGGLAYVDVTQPRQGIQARRWDQEIIRQTQQYIEQQAEQAIARGITRSGHSL